MSNTLQNKSDPDNAGELIQGKPVWKLDFNNGSGLEDNRENFVYQQIKQDGQTRVVNFEDSTGALHIKNTATDTADAELLYLSGSVAGDYRTTSMKHMLPDIDLTKGCTIDIDMKIDNLPEVKGLYEAEHPPFGQSGLVFLINLVHGNYGKGFCFSFFREGEATTMGFCYGQIETIDSDSSGWEYFLDAVSLPIGDGQYHRYTLVFDYIEGQDCDVTFYLDGEYLTEFAISPRNNGRASVGTTALNKATLNYFYIGAKHNELVYADELYYSDVYLDRAYIYEGSYIPVNAIFGSFEQPFLNELREYYHDAGAILARTDTSFLFTQESIADLTAAKEEIDENHLNLSNLSKVPLNTIKHYIEILKTALYGMTLKHPDRVIQIAYDYRNTSTWGGYNEYGHGWGYPYAWTNSAILISPTELESGEAQYNSAEYRNAGGWLNRGWAAIKFWHYFSSQPILDFQGYNTTKKIADYNTTHYSYDSGEDVAIIYLHKYESDQYMSKAFGDSNAAAFEYLIGTDEEIDGGVSVTGKFVLYSPTPYKNNTSVLSLGTWYSKQDPANGGYLPDKPEGMKDYFKDFKTFCFLYNKLAYND